MLVDKDGVARMSRIAQGAAVVHPPTEVEFLTLVGAFWSHVYCAARQLHRGELWNARGPDAVTKRKLLKMLEWHAQLAGRWDPDRHYDGKELRRWVSDDVWRRLHHAFSRFDAEDAWHGLRQTCDLFREVTTAVAAKQGFTYPQAVDANIGRWMQRLRPSQRPADPDCGT